MTYVEYMNWVSSGERFFLMGIPEKKTKIRAVERDEIASFSFPLQRVQFRYLTIVWTVEAVQ